MQEEFDIFCSKSIRDGIFFESKYTIAIYDIAPVVPGHSLIIPKRHVSNLSGKITNVLSKGNDNAHIVLRGGNDGPNYNIEKVQEALKKLKEKGLFEKLIIDCSHGNSQKDHNKQPEVFFDVIKQIYDGNKGIFGLMLESNIAEGRQEITSKELTYGVSITDSCIGWDRTEKIIKEAAKTLRRKH